MDEFGWSKVFMISAEGVEFGEMGIIIRDVSQARSRSAHDPPCLASGVHAPAKFIRPNTPKFGAEQTAFHYICTTVCRLAARR